jgi:hypothetical protein
MHSLHCRFSAMSSSIFLSYFSLYSFFYAPDIHLPY